MKITEIPSETNEIPAIEEQWGRQNSKNPRSASEVERYVGTINCGSIERALL